MDWLRGGGSGNSSWDEHLRSKLSQAASSARRLAEQAELPQLGEQLRASVQQIAEQGGNAIQHAQAPRQADAPPHVSPLQSELQHIGTQLFASAQNLAEQTGAALATTADKVVGGVSALGIPGAPGSGLPHAAGDMGELGRSFESEAHALEASSSPLERSLRTLNAWHMRLTPEVAGEETATMALRALLQSQAIYILLKALARSLPGRGVIGAAAAARSPSESSPNSKKDEDVTLDAKAGRFLLRVLCRTSAASIALLRQLLTLLADVAEESARSAATNTGGKGASGEDVQWVLQLICASLVHANEVELSEAGQLRKLVDRALADSSVASAVPSQSACQETPTNPDVPEPGAAVWAAWPGDGRWYRASVKAVGSAPGRRVEVAWLRPPNGEDEGYDVEYLSSTGAEDTLFTQVGAESVVAVTLPRPSQTVLEPHVQDERWSGQLSVVEDASRNFRDLRSLCSALAPSGSSPTASNQEDASLSASAAILETLRAEGERRAAELAKAAVECANSAKGQEEQLSTSHKSFESELGALREQQEALSTREAQLKRERDDLCAKLQALDEQLEAARAARQEAQARERQVRAAEERVESELQRELTTGEETGQSLASWQRLLIEASAASRDVEELISRRATSVREKAAAKEDLGARLPAVAALCLSKERARGQQMEELLASWHTAIWGPTCDALVRDSARLAAIRALHMRAGSVAETAWRESVQLAAEELGGGSLGADSEAMSRAAEKYKKMRHQLHGNLERLSKLEASCNPSDQKVAAAASSQEFAPGNRGRMGEAESAPEPADPIPRHSVSDAPARSQPASDASMDASQGATATEAASQKLPQGESSVGIASAVAAQSAPTTVPQDDSKSIEPQAPAQSSCQADSLPAATVAPQHAPSREGPVEEDQESAVVARAQAPSTPTVEQEPAEAAATRGASADSIDEDAE
jgi:hypothetical protein